MAAERCRLQRTRLVLARARGCRCHCRIGLGRRCRAAGKDAASRMDRDSWRLNVTCAARVAVYNQSSSVHSYATVQVKVSSATSSSHRLHLSFTSNIKGKRCMCVVSPPRHETRRSVDALEMCRGSAQRGTRVTRAIQGAIMCEPQRTELEKHQTFFQLWSS